MGTKDFIHPELDKMIWIPPPKGWYLMTDFQQKEYDPENCYFIKLSKGFWIQEKLYSDYENFPRINVSWVEATALAQSLTAKDAKYKYRLPTEAEWQWAACGNQNFIWAGSNNPDEVSWTYENSERLQPVGLKKPNGYGLYDMSGNVQEWVSDSITPNLDPLARLNVNRYMPVCALNPVGPKKGSLRVVRGGSWGYVAPGARVAHRDGSRPGGRYDYLGVRFVCQEKS